MNELQHLMGYDPETGAYHREHMLVRLAQMGVMADRGITQAELSRRLGVSAEAVSLYFRGASFIKPLSKTAHGKHWVEPEADRAARIRAREDDFERAIEAIIAERGLHLPSVVGTPEEHYIPEILTRDLMR